MDPLELTRSPALFFLWGSNPKIITYGLLWPRLLQYSDSEQFFIILFTWIARLQLEVPRAHDKLSFQTPTLPGYSLDDPSSSGPQPAWNTVKRCGSLAPTPDYCLPHGLRAPVFTQEIEWWWDHRTEPQGHRPKATEYKEIYINSRF